MSPDIHPGITFELHTGATVTPDAETGLWCEHWGCPKPGRRCADGVAACTFHSRDHGGQVCIVEGCSKPHRGRGYCNAHYQRWASHGDPLAGGTSPRAVIEDVQTALAKHNAKRDDPCWAWQYATNGKGYGIMTVNGKRMYVHRYVVEITQGPIPDGMEVRHLCGQGLTSGCWNPAHLAIGSAAENAADRQHHGTAAIKLDEQCVADIRLRYKPGVVTSVELAAEYGVTHKTILDVVKRRTWRHVNP